MKILFLVPPETISLESSVPKALEGGKGYYPKLGLLYVAAYYERETGNTATFIDCPPENVSEQALLARVREIKPDMVAMSIMTFNLLDALHTTKVLKQEHPNLKICLGGPHVNLYPKETLNLPGIDYVVFGEGEKIFARFVQALELRDVPIAESLSSINGLGWKLNGTLHINPAETELLDLDELPFPARHLVDVSCYQHPSRRQEDARRLAPSVIFAKPSSVSAVPKAWSKKLKNWLRWEWTICFLSTTPSPSTKKTCWQFAT